MSWPVGVGVACGDALAMLYGRVRASLAAFRSG